MPRRLNMKEAAAKTRGFIRRLQRSDSRTKKRYLYGVSAALMVIVIGLWLAYLNVVLPQAAPEVTASSTATGVAATSSGGSFFGTLGRGFDVVIGNIGGAFGNIGGTVGGAWNKFQTQLQRTNTIQLNATSTQ